MMNRDSLRNLLIRHEGLKVRLYKDSVGKTTIGVGRNIEDVGISEAEALYMLDNDIAKVVAYARQAFWWFNNLDDSRQNVVCSMIFNLGAAGFNDFKKMRAAIEKNDFAGAANEMLVSKWASQVGSRAVELAQMMRDGDTVH